jgi:hypothetical protein
MTVVGVTMVKDEVDIVARTVRHMASQVDHVIVADNMSTDGTRSVLDELARDMNVTVVDDFEVGYHQSKKMTELAFQARINHHADWIVPFDADEWWYSPFGRIGDILDGLASQWLVMEAVLYDHVATGEDDPDELDPIERLGWRRQTPAPLPKVACRWREDLVIEMGNHGARYLGGATKFESQLIIRHFPYRSVEQLIRKIHNGAAAYAATDLDPTYGAHWRQWGEALDDPNRGIPWIEELFRVWYYRQRPKMALDIDGEIQPPLIFDPVANL